VNVLQGIALYEGDVFVLILEFINKKVVILKNAKALVVVVGFVVDDQK
jgi:hypothetical protein